MYESQLPGNPLPPPSSAVAWVCPYDYCHDIYQRYYVAGLQAVLGALGTELEIRSLQRAPALLRALRRVRYSYRLERPMSAVGPMVDGIARLLGGQRTPPSGRFHPLAGQYEFALPRGESVRLVIDSADAGGIVDEGLLASCNVYAKSNYRRDVTYPHHVVPVANVNPIVIPYLPFLRKLRRSEPRYDVVCVVRVWGGSDELSGIEHNIRLLEALNKARCRKFLLAYLVAGDVPAQEQRLRSQGIATTRKPMPRRQLWEVSAASRINVIRLGMHNCIPWRFTDLLAMGACVAFDQAPQTIWPVPLFSGHHFLDLGLATATADGMAAKEAYDAIPARIEAAVADIDSAERVRAAAADYYDRNIDPVAVGSYLLDRVQAARTVAQA